MTTQEDRDTKTPMPIDRIIEKARAYQFEDATGLVNLGDLLERQHAAIRAAHRFFREAMPQINIKSSAMDANAIDAWNKAEIAIGRAML
ncbi:hypothetical protein [Acetobacter malorum]|nr:hypothetical protein [Acetobacter malorum]